MEKYFADWKHTELFVNEIIFDDEGRDVIQCLELQDLERVKFKLNSLGIGFRVETVKCPMTWVVDHYVYPNQ